jgi:methyl-accepting chemotaxis protein
MDFKKRITYTYSIYLVGFLIFFSGLYIFMSELDLHAREGNLESIKAPLSNFRMMVVATYAVLVPVFFFDYFYLRRRDLATLTKMTKVIDELSQGNFKSRFDEDVKKGEDDWGEIARDFEEVVETFKEGRK